MIITTLPVTVLMAIYRTDSGATVALKVMPYYEDSPLYTRISEPVEVTFRPCEVDVAAQIAAIEAQQVAESKAYGERMKALQAQREALMACAGEKR